MKHKSVILELTDEQSEKLQELYEAEARHANDWRPLVILGQPCLQNGKIKFSAFPHRIARMLMAMFWVVGKFTQSEIETPKHPFYGKRYFWLE